jgi:hypothetical protein
MNINILIVYMHMHYSMQLTKIVAQLSAIPVPLVYNVHIYI